MRINCHGHIFTFHSLFTEQTKHLLSERLENHDFPEPFRTIVVELSTLLVEAKKSIFTSEGIHYEKGVRAIERMNADDARKKDVKKSLKLLKVLNQAYSNNWINLRDVLLELIDPKTDAAVTGPGDWLEFLITGLSPSISDIADRAIRYMHPDDIFVAHMIEFHPGTPDEETDELFKIQVSETIDQCMRYPGRILPFLGVDTRRKDFMAKMEQYLETGACVGVKIYPSSGFPLLDKETGVVDEKIAKVFEKCEKLGTPVMMHCSKGGYCDNDCVEYASPANWTPILSKYKKLKICFGHFGGDDFWVGENKKTKDPWHTQIVELMKNPDNSNRVYGDISFHAYPFKKKEYLEKYKACFKSIYEQCPANILWGTDFLMLLLTMQDRTYWKVFEEILGQSQFKRISEENPLSYLGIDPDFRTQAHSINIKRHIGWLGKNIGRIRKMRVKDSKPGIWLPKELRDQIEN